MLAKRSGPATRGMKRCPTGRCTRPPLPNAWDQAETNLAGVLSIPRQLLEQRAVFECGANDQADERQARRDTCPRSF